METLTTDSTVRGLAETKYIPNINNDLPGLWPHPGLSTDILSLREYLIQRVLSFSRRLFQLPPLLELFRNWQWLRLLCLSWYLREYIKEATKKKAKEKSCVHNVIFLLTVLDCLTRQMVH